mgnify:CR=1 FL=1
MSDFTITHSSATQMAHTASSELAGAVLRDDYDGPAFYRACTAAELDEHLDAGREIVFGYDPDEIEQQLHAKFPIDSPVLHRVLRKDGYVPEAEERQWGCSRRSRRYRYVPEKPEKKAACWLVLSHPFIDLEQLDQQETVAPASEILRRCIADYGLILVKSDYRTPERWKDQGFTSACRSPDLLLLNFNPQRLEQKRFQEAKQIHEHMLRGFFPHEEMRRIYQLIQSLDGVETPYKSVLQLGHIPGTGYREMGAPKLPADSRGKCLAGCARYAANIRLALQLVRRLAPKAGAWWREAGVNEGYRGSYRGYYAFSVADVVPKLLPWLHGVEAVCKYTPEQLDTIEEFYEEGQADIQHLRWFCRWVRTEARVANLPIPPKPVAPKPPSSKKPKRRGSKGSAAKASRSRKKSAAPAPPVAHTPSDASAS